MALHKIKQGLDLPISGSPRPVIADRPDILRVALMGDDSHGLRVRPLVEEGQKVKRGQPLYEDRKNPGVTWTSPGAGEVVAINRGHRRMLQSYVVQLNEAERKGDPPASDCHAFAAYRKGAHETLDADGIRALLLESGLWTAFRTRPFSKVPPAEATPVGIFVTAIDTNPLAADPDLVLADRQDDFNLGLRLLNRLIEGDVYLCIHADSTIRDWLDAPDIAVHRFKGPHPAGNAGLHIHRILPVGRTRTVWTIGYQDVAAIGKLATTGVLPVDRIISVAGPVVKDPSLVRSRIGASVDDHVHDRIHDGVDVRVISGSVLSGKKAMGAVFGHVGRYDTQISVLQEGTEREFMGWLDPGFNKFSAIPVYVTGMLEMVRRKLTEQFGPAMVEHMDLPDKKYAFTTALNGSPRPIIPINVHENVMPMDILPTYLLRSMAVGDIEQAEKLGILELDEEDLALCTFVDPGKSDFGPMLRVNLDRIEKEG